MDLPTSTLAVAVFVAHSRFFRNTRTWAPVNLDRLQAWINQGRLISSPKRPITARQLLLSGCVHNAHDGIKVLGDGASYLTSPVHIIASRASKSAISAIEAKGGSVFCKHYNVLALRDCIKGNKHWVSAAPTRKLDISLSLPSFMFSCL